MSVAGVKKPRLKAITAIVPAIADISTSPMMGFFRPQEEVIAAKEAYDKGGGELMYLNFMPRALMKVLHTITAQEAPIPAGAIR